MKKKLINILKMLVIYTAIYLGCTIIFIALFHTKLLDNMKVLMYRGIIFIFFTGLLSALCMEVVRRNFGRKLFNVKDTVLMFCGFCCVNMVLFTMIPVTVERSVSVFMLSYMEENSDQTYTTDDVSKIFVDKYVNEYGAFDKRFEEQLVSGNIEKNENGTYSITDRGRKIVDIFRIVAKWFHTDQRLVYPNEN